ncbi:Na(+)/H(+) antiporter subunit A [Xylanibacillus composti]|uniref:Na(+)/H(+) antiporter subunit A n=1 Tax=Xylanibacillus composti TaxID=1572762 RepID=A0A8J4H5N0_9BACL|nr:Na+/H+ antiporter subunit A [Xylanibacillus composti]GIQ70151.1 Na(+)/H(+) antiporter subunit A [Xylanibacillus composti]
MSWLHLIVLAPFLATVFIPVIHKAFPKLHIGWAVLPLPIALLISLLSQIGKVSSHVSVEASMPWIPSYGIYFDVYLDGLSMLFALLITGIGTLVVLYSIYYLDKHKERLQAFYVYLLLFMGAMLGVVLSDNLMLLYMFWETTSLASFLLIAYWTQREKSRYGAQKSMLITVFGGMAMFAGFILLYVMGGTFSIRGLVEQAPHIAGDPLFIPALVLVLLGAFTKSAQFPFHIWLPDAMEAPTPVSAYLHSATMVKAGLYLVARMTPIFAGQAEWFWLVAGFGLFTLLWGSFSAVKQTDLKSILAFSTVSQLGLIMSLLGVGSLAVLYDAADERLFYAAVLAAVFHLFNHATFKGALFMVAGIVDHETGTRDIRKLGGLMSLMPITFTIAVVGGLSMAGLPPFNGFLSKEMFFTGMLKVLEADVFALETWGILFPIIAVVASVFTFVYSLMLVMRTFLGKLQPEKLEKKPHEAPIGMLIPPIVLASLVLLVGFYPNLIAHSLLEPAVSAILPNLLAPGDHFETHISFWHGWTAELFMTMGVVAVGLLLVLTLRRWVSLYDHLPQRLTLNRLYDGMLLGLQRGSSKGTEAYMSGSLRTYLIYIFLFFILVIGGSLAFIQPTLQASGYAPLAAYEWLLGLILAGAAAAIVLVSSRMSAILAAGAVGYMVSLYFVILRAPDLALTQLVVETVSVALFLLCFYHLPKLRRDMNRVRFQSVNFLIAIGVGAIITILTLAVQGVRPFDSISDYFIANAHDEAGGDNVVNVILVDFRGFDTMLEILVLGIAAIGIYALIKLRLGGDYREHQ